MKKELHIPEGTILNLLDYAGWKYKKIGSKYMGACPACNRGHNTPNTVFNTDTNSFKCFNCGESGGLKKIAELLGVDFREFLIQEGIIKNDRRNKKSK
jgi:DNA primase